MRKRFRAEKARDQQALAADQQTLASRQEQYENARDADVACLRSASAIPSGGATTTTTVTTSPTGSATVTQTAGPVPGHVGITDDIGSASATYAATPGTRND